MMSEDRAALADVLRSNGHVVAADLIEADGKHLVYCNRIDKEQDERTEALEDSLKALVSIHSGECLKGDECGAVRVARALLTSTT